MDKIVVTRIAQTVPVCNGVLKPETTPEQFLNNIIGVTFKKSLNKGQNVQESLTDNSKDPKDLKLLTNVLDQNHGSTLEHVYLTYAIINASRSYLAQQTRHRIMSYTSSSQHYIDHTEMNDAEVPVELLDPEKAEELGLYMEAYSDVKAAYNKLVAMGVDHSVARQLLPNAQRNLLIVTANMRSWLNFMNQRLCFRNTSEILYIAKLIRDDIKTICPTIAEYMGPDCWTCGHCTQKAMSCGRKWTPENLDEQFKTLTLKKELKNNGN